MGESTIGASAKILPHTKLGAIGKLLQEKKVPEPFPLL